MKKYVKKQEFEAVQWTGDLGILSEFKGEDFSVTSGDDNDPILNIRDMSLSVGDWFVRGGGSKVVLMDADFQNEFKPLRAKKKTKPVEQENA